MTASGSRFLCGVLAAFSLLILATAGLAQTPAPNKLTDAEIAEGWLLLFDGEGLFGWKAADQAQWKVADGAITLADGKSGSLRATSQFDNYVLKIDYRCDKGGKLFLGVQWQFDGGNVPGWHSVEITIDGSKIVVAQDGKVLKEAKKASASRRNSITLNAIGRIELRNIKLKPLATKSIFNGKDLTGWKNTPKSKSVASVTPEGWLNLKNGWGDIETAGQYADFTLQLEVLVNGKNLNSGVFFRCIPGEIMNGYECQIHNGYKDNDRSKPQDCGTGGIFRRQPARKVVSDDFQWFALSIHADGPHVATWVNGYQVADWTDERAPHDNPRNGLRLKAGTIQIQGHDATTDLSLRKVRVAELPPQ